MVYVWKDDLNTGVTVIDAQHRRILAALNQMLEAQLSGNRALVAEALDELLDYTLSHFAFEEELMDEVGYSHSRSHKHMHRIFSARIETFRQRFQRGEQITEELAALLAQWLFSHIRHDDQLCVKEVRERMLRVTADTREGSWLQRALGRFFGKPRPS